MIYQQKTSKDLILVVPFFCLFKHHSQADAYFFVLISCVDLPIVLYIINNTKELLATAQNSLVKGEPLFFKQPDLIKSGLSSTSSLSERQLLIIE